MVGPQFGCVRMNFQSARYYGNGVQQQCTCECFGYREAAKRMDPDSSRENGRLQKKREEKNK